MIVNILKYLQVPSEILEILNLLLHRYKLHENHMGKLNFIIEFESFCKIDQADHYVKFSVIKT